MPVRMRFVTAAMSLLLAAVVAAAPGRARADEPGVKGEMLTWIKDAEEKLTDLSGAVPENKYSWRPGKGVRSVGEVYMHVAAANYGIPALLGTAQPPAGFDFEKYEGTLTKKDDIRKALKESFASMESSLQNASDADLDKQVKLFGMDMTVRGAYMLVLSHVHEHLGQSIAYARSNGVVPPWTAKQQAAVKEMEKKAKDEAAAKK